MSQTRDTRSLQLNETAQIAICARPWWNDTGIRLEADSNYRFFCDPSQQWFDASNPYSADGYPSKNVFQSMTEKLRRAPVENWFVLMGAIDKDSNTTFRIGTRLDSYSPNFYGTTYTGGTSNKGTVFQMTPAGVLTTVVNFTGDNGSNPQGGLIRASDGHLYGMTTTGGLTSDGLPAGGGQIYRLRMGPSVTSQAASSIVATSATINATINPGGYLTPVSFQYGTSPTLDTFSTVSAGSLSAGTNPVAVQSSLSGLSAFTTYYFRAVASNDENTVPQAGAILSFTTGAPDISIEQPAGSALVAGSSVAFGNVTLGSSADLIFTVRNIGNLDLASLAVSIDGTNSADFSAGTIASTTVTAGGSTTFHVSFTPGAGSPRTATLHVASNVTGAKNPFDIILSGFGNTVPVFAGYTVSTPYQTAVTISLGKLLTGASDADGDAVSVASVGASAHSGTVVLQSTSILYTPPSGYSGTDTFPVNVIDARGASASGTVTVTVQPLTDVNLNPPALTPLPDGHMSLTFQGIPGRIYQVQRSTDLRTWLTIATLTAGPTGAISYVDSSPPAGSAYYRLSKP